MYDFCTLHILDKYLGIRTYKTHTPDLKGSVHQPDNSTFFENGFFLEKITMKIFSIDGCNNCTNPILWQYYIMIWFSRLNCCFVLFCNNYDINNNNGINCFGSENQYLPKILIFPDFYLLLDFFFNQIHPPTMLNLIL